MPHAIAIAATSIHEKSLSKGTIKRRKNSIKARNAL
jgi:hypothetical protein